MINNKSIPCLNPPDPAWASFGRNLLIMISKLWEVIDNSQKGLHIGVIVGTISFLMSITPTAFSIDSDGGHVQKDIYTDIYSMAETCSFALSWEIVGFFILIFGAALNIGARKNLIPMPLAVAVRLTALSVPVFICWFAFKFPVEILAALRGKWHITQFTPPPVPNNEFVVSVINFIINHAISILLSIYIIYVVSIFYNHYLLPKTKISKADAPCDGRNATSV
ncbi:hypothetical protein [Nitrospirillum viridazoti]|uniref:hypothetical protein n=1 Tax=Nitrospirillum viridazoti TaxID=3144925 RepID=UPI0011A61226|nr:hypothetical protein [Nitrospirillum amazonense]TWB34908.1 hypothetical protein FBZ91_111240 [Nitrospirillum amazonense]